MTTASTVLGTLTQLPGAAAALNNLANGTYVVVGTITHSVAGKVPSDCFVEIAVTPGTVAGNKKADIFAMVSGDGTTFSTGPSSGTVVTDESNLVFIGVLPLGTSALLQRRRFSLAAPNGYILPFGTKLIVKNDSGAAFAAAGNDVYTQIANGDLS